MFKKLILLVLGGLALREVQKRGYLDKLPSGETGKLPFPTSATAPSASTRAETAPVSTASPMANASPPIL